MNILEHLPIVSNSLFVGKVACYEPTIDSTNSAATRLLSKSNPTEGMVLYTDHQSAGRGQIGSRWQSAAGQNLLLSIILYPKFLLVTQQFKLHQVVALALCEALSAHLSDPTLLRIKWPNDLYYGDQKMGGILIENTLRGASIQHTIVGIGLNVNQIHFGADLQRATSLRLITGKEQDRKALLGTLCETLERYYISLKNQGYKALAEAYRERLYGYQIWRNYQRLPSGTRFRGKITGVTPSGHLQVQTAHGTNQYDFKELIFEWS